MAKQKVEKHLVVIARYRFKKNGAVVYRVRSSEPNKKGRVEGTDQVERNGLWYDAHNVTVYQNETVCGCTCKGSEFKGKCYHRDGIQSLLDAKKPVLVEPAKVKSIESAPLNGAQQSAGLLMILPSRKAIAS